MMQFKKARLGLAMAAALAGGLGATSTASAAVISDDGLGQALIFPYYTVRDGFESLFNITNTSAETVAVKVRFREAQNSRDVLDFNLVLSPKDVWTGRLRDVNGTPTLTSSDNSCTSPMMPTSGFQAQSVGYTGGFADGGDTNIARTQEGYVEVIMMGRTNAPTGEEPGAANDDGNPMAYYAKHVSGTPRDCSKINGFFVSGTANGSPNSVGPLTNTSVPAGFPTAANHGQDGSGDPEARDYLSAPCVVGSPVDPITGIIVNPGQGEDSGDYSHNGYPAGCLNPLKGNFTLYKPDSGVAGGTDAIAIEDFALAAELISRTGGVNSDLVTAQQYPYFLEPSLASGNGLWTVSDLSDSVASGDPSDGILTTLQRNTMINEWANNPITGAGADWVISMPLKNFFVDASLNNNFQGAMNSARLGTGTYRNAATIDGNNDDVIQSGELILSQTDAGINGLVPEFSDPFDGKSSVQIDYTVYDREEKSVAINETVVSPAPPGTVESLKYEVNVLTFDGTKNLGSAVDSDVGIPSGLNTPNGWVEADISGGIPAVGFVWKTRNFGDSTKNYSQIVPHGYED